MWLNALFSFPSGAGNFCLVHVSLVPVLSVVGEQVFSKEFVLFVTTLPWLLVAKCSWLPFTEIETNPA